MDAPRAIAGLSWNYTMAKTAPRTSPDHETTGWPPGVPYIIGNEGCERFSFYGMRSILTMYLARELYVRHPEFGATPDVFAQSHYHLFVAAVYAFPLIGAVIADKLLGKFQVILYLSLVYCAGHACLAMFEGKVWGIWTGLALIAIGSGGIKPCVSANVGDQFGRNNWFRVRTIFQAFYFIINFGSFFSTLLIPWLWNRFGASVAFGVPGVLMAIATVIFWMGRDKFVQVPPAPGGKLGFIDALSASLMFFALLNLLFGSGPWYTMLAISVLLLAAGLGVFAWRNRIQPDDGFLAVLLYALGLLRSEDRSLAQVNPRATSDVSPELAATPAKTRGKQLLRPCGASLRDRGRGRAGSGAQDHQRILPGQHLLGAVRSARLLLDSSGRTHGSKASSGSRSIHRRSQRSIRCW